MIARAYSVLDTATEADALPHLRLDVRAGAAYFAPATGLGPRACHARRHHGKAGLGLA